LVTIRLGSLVAGGDELEEQAGGFGVEGGGPRKATLPWVVGAMRRGES
jgi:hypothetical protein